MEDRSGAAPRSPDRSDAAARLRQSIPEIMERWEARARIAFPPLRHEPARSIRDLIPAFLEELTAILGPETEEEGLSREAELSKTHGEQRARLPGFELEQVLHEYYLLRHTIFEVLETEGPLPRRERDIILDAVELAMREAGAQFVRTQQEALRRSEEWYRLLVESARDYAMILLDPEGRVIHWNAGAEQLLGYSEAEMLGESSFRIFTPEEIQRGEPEKELQTALMQGRAEDERWHVRKDGSRFWGSGVVRPLRDDNGNLSGFVKVFRDLTDRKRLEEELRQRIAALEAADPQG